MIEWLVASLLLLALVVLVGRKGHRHLLGRKLPWVIVAAGGGVAWMLESLPFTPFRAKPSILTALAVGCGLFAARLFARGIVGWARGQERDLAAGAPAPTGIAARLVHPLIGAGLFLSGAYLLFLLVAGRHETLEVLAMPRDPETAVMRGAEDLRLDGDPSLGHAVVLVHGFNGSPADFGDLPRRLQSAGFGVRLLRLPGHGSVPSALDDTSPEKALEAVEAARAELEKSHARVSIVGFSYGGALAIRAAAARAPHRLVLVNPWLGENVRPVWCPVPLEGGANVVSSLTTRVIRPPGFWRCNDPEGRPRVRTYMTIRTKAIVATRDFTRASASPEIAAKLTSPALLLLSTGDHTNPAEHGAQWFATLPPSAQRRVVRYERSDHLLFLDYDRDAATKDLIEFLR